MNQAQLLAKRADHKTAHILHLALSLITGGVWLPVWFLVALGHQLTRDSIDRQLARAGK